MHKKFIQLESFSSPRPFQIKQHPGYIKKCGEVKNSITLMKEKKVVTQFNCLSFTWIISLFFSPWLLHYYIYDEKKKKSKISLSC